MNVIDGSYDDIVAWALEHPQYARRHPLSDVLEVNLSAYNGTNATIMVGQVFAVLRRTTSVQTVNLAATMGLLDFNRRQSPFVDISYLNNCSMFLSLDLGDEYSSIIDMAGDWLDRVVFYNSSRQLRPMAVAGPTTSGHSFVAAQLGASAARPQATPHRRHQNGTLNIEGVLTISPSATSQELDFADLFARTIPTNLGDAEALAVYLQSIGTRHLAVFYVNDSYGRSFMLNLQSAVNRRGMHLHLFPYDAQVESSLSSAMEQLRQSPVRYVFGVIYYSQWQEIARALAQAKLLGNTDYAWFFSDSWDRLLLTSKTDGVLIDEELATAINGSAVVSIMPPEPQFAAFASAMQASVEDPAFVEYFASRFLKEAPTEIAWEPSMFAMLGYEAIMTIGHAACRMEFDDFTGPQLYEHVKATEYTGVSGHVTFDAYASRVPADMVFQIANIVTRATGEAGTYRTEGRRALEIQTTRAEPILEVQPLLFASGSTAPPPNLRAVEINENLVPLGVQVFIWVLSGLVLLFAFYCIAWTVKCRKEPKVRASQPVFLILVCIGPIMVALAAILSTFQEPIPLHILTAVCMVHIWLLSVGFCLTFSVLFAKTWRINRVYAQAKRFRRAQVKAGDVIWPLCALLAVNVSILIAWTVRSPPSWQTTVTQTGSLGETLATKGTCYIHQADFGELNESWIFLGLILAVNLVALIVANYQSFRARNLPTEFNESYYIAMTNAILLEDLVLGIPVMLVVGRDPTILVLVTGLVSIIFCLAVLLPMFVPKFHSSKDEAVRISAFTKASSGGFPSTLKSMKSIPSATAGNKFMASNTWAGQSAKNDWPHDHPVDTSSRSRESRVASPDDAPNSHQ